MKNILITGTSSGIGMATALEMARAGHRVFATMRNPAGSPRLGEIAKSENLPIEIRTLDVDSDDSVKQCFGAIGERLDVLVNNAGVECHGAVEELPMEAIAAAMNTNYLGAVRCMKAVLPSMREARSGCIINISSVSGRLSNSPLGAYSASKFALEAISRRALRLATASRICRAAFSGGYVSSLSNTSPGETRIRPRTPPLRIHHILIVTAVAAVLLSESDRGTRRPAATPSGDSTAAAPAGSQWLDAARREALR